MSGCLGAGELAALAGGESPTATDRAHVAGCRRCRNELEKLGAVASWLRTSDVAPAETTGECLSDDAISRLIDGRSAAGSGPVAAHLSSCPRCRRRLATVTAILDDPGVVVEARRAGSVSRHIRPHHAAALLAAAVIAGIWLLPHGTMAPSDAAENIHRESAITTTIAPIIVGPGASASVGDTLRWTRVPHADLYEVKVYDRDGTLVLNPRTTDTLFVIPGVLTSARTGGYSWKVEARTSFDRWVSSEWSDLTIVPDRRTP